MENIYEMNDDALLMQTFDKSTDILFTERGYKDNNANACYSINLDRIASKLINEVGRFCEHYASDFLIDWYKIRKEIDNNEAIAGERKIFTLGLRESGVDGNTFIMNHLRNNWVSSYYRRIYAVSVTHTIKNETSVVYVELRDIREEMNNLAYQLQRNALLK